MIASPFTVDYYDPEIYIPNLVETRKKWLLPKITMIFGGFGSVPVTWDYRPGHR